MLLYRQGFNPKRTFVWLPFPDLLVNWLSVAVAIGACDPVGSACVAIATGEHPVVIMQLVASRPHVLWPHFRLCANVEMCCDCLNG